MDMKKEFILGLDIGTASIGWALIEADLKEGVGRFIEEHCGVEKFEEGQLAEDRRLKRSSRRNIARTTSRINQVKNLFNAMPNKKLNVWQLRVKALNELLNEEELARLCLYFAKHRGFKIIHGQESDEDGKVKKGSEENKKNFEASGYRTIGEYLAYQDKKRNSDSYNLTVHRSLLIDEIETIFDKQIELGSTIATEELKEKFLFILNFVRPLKSFENMIGHCCVEKGEKRAPKGSYSFELYSLIQNLQNARFFEIGKQCKSQFSPEEINKIVDNYISSGKEFFNINDILKVLNKINVVFKDSNSDTPFKIGMKVTYKLRKLLKDEIINLSEEEIKNLFNTITTIFVNDKDSNVLELNLLEKGISQNIIKALFDKKFSTSCVANSYSIKALDKLITLMLEGYRPEEARDILYPENAESVEKSNYLPVIKNEDLPSSPVVKRALSKTRKIINSILRTYGVPDRIIVETGRELGKSKKNRDKIAIKQGKNRKERELARAEASEILNLNIDNVSNKKIEMFKLWRDQKGISPYSGKAISASDIVNGETQVDHVFPKSRSFDDSYKNKVLCFVSENQDKDNMTPYEFLGNNAKNGYVSFDEYIEILKSFNIPEYKKYHLSIPEPELNGFKAYQLNGMRETTKYMIDYMKKHLSSKVYGTNGQLTSALRNMWKIDKNREESDKHHFVDASIIACTTLGMQNRITRECKLDRKGHKNYPLPWESFKDELLEINDKLFVRRVERKKTKGALHEETVRGIVSDKNDNPVYTTKRTFLKNLSPSVLKEIREGNIEKVVHNISRDKDLLKAVVDRVVKFPSTAKGKDIFAEPLFVREKEVKALKIIDTSVSGVRVRGGIAANGDMVRVDIFSVTDKKGKKKYGGLPVYTAGEGGKVIFGKDNKKDKSECNFEYSLYKNSIVELVKENKLMYFLSYNVSNNGVTLCKIDGSKIKDDPKKVNFIAGYSLNSIRKIKSF